MSISERAMPPLNTDERDTLEGWLDFYRTTLLMKCQDLDEAQLREVSAAPSPLTLLGLLQHMAEVERNWFRRVLTGEQVPPIYSPEADPEGPDGGFDVGDTASLQSAVARWHMEVSRARENCSVRALEETGSLNGAEVTLRWIYMHMIAEYARHCGHADLLRERIDGRTGV